MVVTAQQSQYKAKSIDYIATMVVTAQKAQYKVKSIDYTLQWPCRKHTITQSHRLHTTIAAQQSQYKAIHRLHATMAVQKAQYKAKSIDYIATMVVTAQKAQHNSIT